MKTVRYSFVWILLISILFGTSAQAQRAWNPTTKGTVIGAGVGAATGAIINKKNRAVGAVVGGVVGGAAGYGYAKSNAKKRWSPQAKGTAIGAGAGAAAGAVINKRNRAVGAVIGGVAGGAAGYAIGKHIDNKQKARIAAAERAAAEREAAQESRELASANNNRVYTATNPKPAYNAAVVAKSAATALPTNDLTSYLIDGIYLPNEYYGDQNFAYSTSEVRRKSW
ncbi:hypothetical protein BN8_02299 [Fibrisoma limi BUZ 3]|uniref:YMGG-like Gly-zipper domain-containing protein n=1 Tax=Fibrisoma limi BUZ 3 TaxID=1185876 RepID=I2GH47_9BACT|nr:YMGG-like glycine zipper-containing protein [Fibrisoma limi]CCH53222.1 hypothetical protein BN8_02299 [Fibrisoma limi BUZ 3]